MSHLVSLPNPGKSNRRRFGRFPVAVPVDIVVLRSGVPSTIPGRSIEVSEGGVSAVLAGEVQPGEAVGVALQLPFVLEPVQAKAVVRHLGPMRCGIQFIAMSAEQLTALRTWARMAAERSGVPSRPQLIDQRKPEAPSTAREAAPRAVGLRKPGMRAEPAEGWRPQLRWFVLLLIATLAGLGWWWYSGWNLLDDKTVTAAPGEANPVTVPGSVMQQRLLHRVDPEYPAEAENARLQGLVVLNASIAPDGTVKGLEPVSGPPLLVQAASEAVRWWRFQPYEVSGQAVPVETTIEIDFQLPK
jgi:TonB family protein